MKKLILFTLTLVFMFGAACIKQPQQIFTTTSTFDREMAEHQLRPGNNTIKGSALLRQSGGGVVTGAGNKVGLVPFTPYTQERMGKIYLNENGGYNRLGFQGLLERDISTPKAPGYDEAVKETTADAQGFFTFNNLADGTYYVVTTIAWVVANQPQGGALMKKVTVSGGEVKEVVLTSP